MKKKKNAFSKQKVMVILIVLVLISAVGVAISLRSSSSEPISGKAFADLSSGQKQLYWKCMTDNKCNVLLKEAQVSKDYTAYRKCAKDCSDSASNLKPESYYCNDSDGTDFLTKSKVVSNLYPQGKEDYCFTFPNGKTYLMEGICKDNKYAYVQKGCGEISTGHVCEEGKCIQDVSDFALEEVPLDWDLTKPIYSKTIKGIFAEETDSKGKKVSLQNLTLQLFMDTNLQYYVKAEWKVGNYGISQILIFQNKEFKLTGQKENQLIKSVSIYGSSLIKGQSSSIINENQEYTFVIRSSILFPPPQTDNIEYNFTLKTPQIAKAKVECKKVVDNGLSEEKIDLVFVPGEYSDAELDTFEQDVHDLLFGKVPDSVFVGERISFFDVPVFNQSFNLFNAQIIASKISCCENNQLLSVVKNCGFNQEKDVIVVMSNSGLVGDEAEGIGIGNRIFMSKGYDWKKKGIALAHEFAHLIGMHEEYYIFPAKFTKLVFEIPNCEFGNLTCNKWCAGTDIEKTKQIRTAKEKRDTCKKILADKNETAWKDFCPTLDLNGTISNAIETGGSYAGAKSQEEYCAFPLSKVSGYTCYAGTFWSLDRDESLNLGIDCQEGYQCYYGCGGNCEWTRSNFVNIMGGGAMGETPNLYKQKEKNAGEKILPDFSPAANKAIKEYLEKYD